MQPTERPQNRTDHPVTFSADEIEAIANGWRVQIVRLPQDEDGVSIPDSDQQEWVATVTLYDNGDYKIVSAPDFAHLSTGGLYDLATDAIDSGQWSVVSGQQKPVLKA